MIPVFDGHNDALTRDDHALLAAGRDGGHLDLPRMRVGGLRGGIFAVFTPSPHFERSLVAREDGVREFPPAA
ncbi:MAG: peptidase, partial [Solirubrobacteraceae bacterium]